MAEHRLTSKEALQIIAVTGIVLSSMIMPQLPIAFGILHKEWKKYHKNDISRLVRRFYKSGLLSIHEDGEELILKLSDKGKTRLVKNSITHLTHKRRQDGKLHLVTFDIPEKQKLAREIFRKKLVELGFRMHQKSTFITHWICEEEVEFLTHSLEITQYVSLFKIDKIELGTVYEIQK